MSQPAQKRLNQDQRDEITRRVLAGEPAAALGREFGVSRAYAALLKAQALDPERFIRKQESMLSQKLTAAEVTKFHEVLSTKTPEDLDLVPTSEFWSYEHVQQLARRLFPNKRPSVRVLKECLAPYQRKRSEFRITKPQPPKPHHINQLPPELAKDPDFVAYYLSPVSEKLAWREYELALADWNTRHPEGEPPETLSENPQADSPAPAMPTEPAAAPGQRVGKHAKSKGSPFTPPKRRRKKR
jgi:hypothetical protein